MAVPEQIRKQTEAVNSFYSQDDSTRGEQASDADVAASNQAEGTISTLDSATAAASESAREHGGSDDLEDARFAHKYKTLQGMYNADVGRLTAANRDMTARVSHLETLLASLSAPPAPVAQSAPSAPVSSLTETDMAEYGDSIEVMRKVAQDTFSPVFSKVSGIERAVNELAAKLNTSVVPQVERVSRQQAASAEDRFWSALNAELPDWQKINNNKAFLDWLAAVDPLTNLTRQQYLDQAQSALDVSRVVAIFRAFASKSEISSAPTNAQPSRSASELERQVAPGRGRSSATTSSEAPKTYTPVDIRKFFEDVRQGKYKGRESERDRIERDIFAAQRDGRIVATA